MPEVLDLNVTSLQNETNAYLKKVSDSIKERSEYESDLQQIKEQIKLVENLELRMVIIAVMNAGKSTLINALIGQEILPTHGDSMTTLPTDVVLNSTLLEPILTLESATVSVFKEAIATLQKEMKTQESPESSGLEWAKENTKKYAHLASLLEKIQTNEIQLVEKVKGREAIAALLKELNHIIRLCNALVPDRNSFGSIKDFPRIEAPFWQPTVSGVKELKKSIHGKLVIVDTPGPNEAGQTGLIEIVKSQLKQSSLILVVLDFLNLRGTEADKLKELVNESIELRDKKNLYVVVNKKDERTEDALNSEEVKEFAKESYNISAQNQVFEVSARWAFMATEVLRELDFNPQISIEALRDKKNIITFAKENYGRNWQQQLSGLNKDQIKSDAEQLWKDSGFATLLKQVIALLPAAEHHCMRTAMDIASKKLRQVHNISLPLSIDQFKKMYDELS